MQSVENPNQGEQETHEGHFFKIIEKTKKAKEEKGSKECRCIDSPGPDTLERENDHGQTQRYNYQNADNEQFAEPSLTYLVFFFEKPLRIRLWLS